MKWLYIFLLIPLTGFSQSLELKDQSPLDADRFFGVDTYNHIYFSKSGTLYKQGELGNFQFQDFQLGPLSSVDIINPLNLVLFYEQTNTVVFLDNRLNEKERIVFNELPSFLNLSMVSNAGNNRLWVFNIDTQELQLYQYRTQLQTVVSQPFNGMVKSYVSNFNDCTLLTENFIRKINIYGSLLFEIPSEGIEQIIQHNQTLFGLKQNKLFKITPENIEEIEFDFKDTGLKDLQLTKDFLYIYGNGTLSKYQINRKE